MALNHLSSGLLWRKLDSCDSEVFLARASRMVKKDHFVTSARHPPADGQEFHFAAKSCPSGTPVSLLVDQEPTSGLVKNRAQGGIWATKAAESDKNGDSCSLRRKSDNSAAFRGFITLTRRIWASFSRITHLFLDITVRSPLSGRLKVEVLVILEQSGIHPILRQEFTLISTRVQNRAPGGI